MKAAGELNMFNKGLCEAYPSMLTCARVPPTAARSTEQAPQSGPPGQLGAPPLIGLLTCAAALIRGLALKCEYSLIR